MKRAGSAAAVAIAFVTAIVLLVACLIGAAAFSIHAHSSADRAARLQALASAGGLIATAILVAVTAYYAWITYRILAASGPLVSATVRGAWVYRGGRGAITVPLDGKPLVPADEGAVAFMFAVILVNRGGGDVTINRVALEFANGWRYFDTASVIGPSIPHRLQGHSTETFFIQGDAAEPAFDMAGSRTLRGYAELGNGDEIRTPATPALPAIP